MNFTRRKIVTHGIPSAAALLGLAACASVANSLNPILNSTTNYYNEVGSGIVASTIALTVFTGLVTSGVLKKDSAAVVQAQKVVTTLDGVFKSASASALAGKSLESAVVTEITDNLGVLKGLFVSNPPTPAQVSVAKVARDKFNLAHPKAVSVASVLAVLSLVNQYLPQIIQVSTSVATWVQNLIGQVKGTSSVTAQNIADDYASFQAQEVAFTAALAA